MEFAIIPTIADPNVDLGVLNNCEKMDKSVYENV